jgi:hypothetical protein
LAKAQARQEHLGSAEASFYRPSLLSSAVSEFLISGARIDVATRVAIARRKSDHLSVIREASCRDFVRSTTPPSAGLRRAPPRCMARNFALSCPESPEIEQWIASPA